MPLNSISDLQNLRENIIEDIDDSKPTIVISAGTACEAAGAGMLQRLVKRQIIKRDLIDRIGLRITGDHGFCVMAPYVLIEPQHTLYVKVQREDVPRLVDSVLSGEILEDLLFHDPVTGEAYKNRDDIPFFKKQCRTILGHHHLVDPIRIFNYIGCGGYGALEKALEMKPEEIISSVKSSGLRGRGGAGFLAGKKWELARAQPDRNGKIVICNADEGDPGAYMDRAILEGNPHSVIEGMIIGGLAMGATRGLIYVRHEYPLAIKHTVIALRQARERNLLGENILGSGRSFDIDIVRGAGAFVCGEETALIRSVEGYMGEPRQRPPYPIERGVHGKPTSINNVETWANVPIIINEGHETFAAVGTEKSTGTKVFSVVGKIRDTGLIEVPMGMTIKELVYDIAGGPVDGGKIKAVQIGGPSGGCIPYWRFDLPIDYDSLVEAGAIMGSGGMIVMDESTCMVDVAKYFMNFLRDESCGKCFTCRKGTQRMYEILDDITSGRGTLAHLDLLEELAHVVQDTSMCGLGQSASNPVLSTLRYFREEYERHIIDKRCDAGVCKDLVGAPCQTGCPVGTEAWRYVAHIARGEYDEAYQAIRAHNPLPSVCARVCDHKCEHNCRLGTTGADPVAIRSLKRFVTDRVDPKSYKPQRRSNGNGNGAKIAVVGAGPAGLAAAHELSLRGYKPTIFEKEEQAGGMLLTGVPSYRLPREVIEREIAALIDDNITLQCGKAIGSDFTIDSLEKDGFKATFLALGAHRSRRLAIEGEEATGIYPSIEFLRAWNKKGEALAKGRVGVIGGGNSAIDAARSALRQPGVDNVTIYYRRTRQEMPAFAAEIEEALEEGVKLELLVSPVKVHGEGGKLGALEVLQNKLGEVDNSGRRRPVPIDGSEKRVKLDTLIVAIGEQMDPFENEGSGVEMEWGSLKADEHTMMTTREGVFAGGDAVTGPNTVIDAIAAGQKVASMIDRFLAEQPLRQPSELQQPSHYVAPNSDPSTAGRQKAPNLAVSERLSGNAEVEQVFDEKAAKAEACRCLRCDLDFCNVEAEPLRATGGQR